MTVYIAKTGDGVSSVNGDDIVFIPRDVHVDYQYVSGSNNFIDVAGTLDGQGIWALLINNGSNETLVEETGQIRGFIETPLSLDGADHTITNYGLIDLKKSETDSTAAIWLYSGDLPGGNSVITNYGLVSSNRNGIVHSTSGAADLLEIDNYGEIKAGRNAVTGTGVTLESIYNYGKITGKIDLGDGADRVVNSGTITGDILLGGGADLYDGSEAAGSVNGTVSGGAGADQLYGGSKSDVLDGGADADYLDGGRGADMLMGGTGDDVYVVDDKLDIVTELAGDANDIVYAKVSYTLASGVEIEKLVTINSSQTTKIDLTGNEFAQTINGNEASNILKGEDGNDLLQGYGGNDTLNGGAGADTMYGGFGDDIYYVNNTSDIATEVGGGGTDLVKSSTSFTLFTDVENLTLTGTSKINGTGNSAANIITGNSAHNVLKGAGGADVFVFNTALVSANYDTISDYSSDDKFQIDNSVFVGLKTGALASSAFKAIASATSTVGVDGTDRILYDKTHGDLYFDQDGSGSTFNRIKFAHITENTPIDNTDFLVI